MTHEKRSQQGGTTRAAETGQLFCWEVDVANLPAPPTLRAGPFVLRPFHDADLAVVAEAATDPQIPLITTVPSPYSERAGREILARQADRLRTDLGYSLAIADADERVIGQIGLWLHSLHKGRASVGYWVVRSARGRGAATHALRAVSIWALSALAVPRLELYIEPWNIASTRTAERAGYHREGLLRGWEEVGGNRRDMLMYSRLAQDRSSE